MSSRPETLGRTQPVNIVRKQMLGPLRTHPSPSLNRDRHSNLATINVSSMLKYIFIGFFVLVVAGMYMIFHFGIRPKAVTIIKPSYFSDHKEAGELLYKVLYPRIAIRDLVVWGIRLQETTSFPMLDGFLSKSMSSERPIDVVVFLGVHKDFVSLTSKAEFVDLDNAEKLSELLKNYLQNKKRVLLVLNILDATHFLKDSYIVALESDLKTKAISILSLPLSQTEDGMSLTQIEDCPAADAQEKYVHSLGCLQLNTNIRALSKNQFHKNKFESNHFTLMMDQEGERDYIAYFSQVHP